LAALTVWAWEDSVLPEQPPDLARIAAVGLDLPAAVAVVPEAAAPAAVAAAEAAASVGAVVADGVAVAVVVAANRADAVAAVDEGRSTASSRPSAIVAAYSLPIPETCPST
jgi:hypothetical protein